MFWKILVAIVLVLAIYMTAVEPNWMKATEQELIVTKLENPLRVLFLSDLQIREKSGYRENWILSQLTKQKVDLIVTTGDLFDEPAGMPAAVEFLDRIANHAPTFAIIGNWEHWSRADLEKYREDLEERGVPLLRNQNRVFSWQGQQISILGVDDPGQHLHNLPLAMKGVPPASLKILLAHAPIIFPLAETNQIDLVFAGHTHGGQVRLPFNDPLFLPPGCGPYWYGTYKKNESTMLVTSGVGTSILPIRFWCRPEIVFLALKPATVR